MSELLLRTYLVAFCAGRNELLAEHGEADRAGQIDSCARFQDVTRGSQTESGVHVIRIGVSRDEDDARGGIGSAETARGNESIHDGHFDIENDDVGMQLVYGRQGLLAIPGRADHIEFWLNHAGKNR